MANLSDTAIFSKKFLIWLGIAILGIIALIILYRVAGIVKNAIAPPKPLPALVSFGKVQKPDYSEGFKSISGITYKLETISGELPALVVEAKIFEIDQKNSSFGALEDVKQTAGELNFKNQPELLSDNNVIFRSSDRGKSQTLKINAVSQNLDYETDFFNNPEIINGTSPTVESAINQASDFLRKFNFDQAEFPNDKIQTRYMRIDGVTLTEVPAIGSANLIEVSFFRADIDKLPVKYSKESFSPARAIVSKKGIVKAEVNKNDINYYKFSTYPLKSLTSAYEELKAGKGVFNKDFSQGEFVIRDVSLGYLETKQQQSYLMPIYIFSGDSGVMTFIDAVSGNWEVN